MSGLRSLTICTLQFAIRNFQSASEHWLCAGLRPRTRFDRKVSDSRLAVLNTGPWNEIPRPKFSADDFFLWHSALNFAATPCRPIPSDVPLLRAQLGRFREFSVSLAEFRSTPLAMRYAGFATEPFRIVSWGFVIGFKKVSRNSMCLCDPITLCVEII